MIGVGQLALVGIQQEGESPVLTRNQLRVVSQTNELKDRVPVGLVVVVADPLLSGQEGVGDGEDLLSGFKSWVGLSGSDRECLAAKPPLPLRSGYEAMRGNFSFFVLFLSLKH